MKLLFESALEFDTPLGVEYFGVVSDIYEAPFDNLAEAQEGLTTWMAESDIYQVILASVAQYAPEDAFSGLFTIRVTDPDTRVFLAEIGPLEIV